MPWHLSNPEQNKVYSVDNWESWKFYLTAMPTIIPGFEYDIFISYRQKDNKGDRWVSKFVDALKTELEATIKEDISVFFDENPHDHLQDTYNVDKSLESKLRCLVFIPILSKTYCDQGSYAWQSEFLTFLRLAENDGIGRDVRLRNGYVASRILPVRIHDLEAEDVKLFEKETGGVLRAMDFVFKTASGVNRPLKANEEHPADNLNKTYYSDQINRVANSIDEIIHSIKAKQAILAGIKEPDDNRISGISGESVRKMVTATTLINKKSKIWLIVTLTILVALAGTFGIFKIIERRTQASDISQLEKSIAVLPFINDSPDQGNTYFINGLMGELLTDLQKINNFRIPSRTSTEKYKGDAKPGIPEIAKKLDVNYIVEGSGQKYGNKIRLRVELIAVKNEKHLWGETYERVLQDSSEIFNLQSQIAQAIVAELKATITPEEKQIIEKVATTNLSAYDFYLRGRDEQTKYWLDNTRTSALANAILYYKQALKSDSTFAQAYTGLAIARFNSYWTNVINRMVFSENDMKIVNDSIITLVDKALKYNKNLEEAYLVRGMCSMEDDRRLGEYKKALEINPNYSYAYNAIAQILRTKGENIDYIKYKLKSIELERGPLLPLLLKDLGDWYEIYGFSENAIDIYNQIFQLTNDTLQYFQNMSGPYFALENWEECIRWANKILEKNPNHLWAHIQLRDVYSFLRKDDLTAYHSEKVAELSHSFAEKEYYRGLLLWEHGDKIKAGKIFEKAVNFSDKLIKAGIDPDFNYFTVARIFSLKGEKNKAMEYFSKISLQFCRQKWVITFMELDPILNNIRSDERFQQILNNSKSDWQREHEKILIWLQQNNLLKV